jgi:hypothetical protein
MRSASIVNLCGYQEAPIGKIATWNELIDKSIRSVGGYWPPLAGVARLLEELGEVAVELRREPRIQNKLAEELADVFFISTCVANQYLADLGAAYADAVLDDSLVIKTAVEPAPIVFLDLLCSASSLARTVNLYEGSKPLKPDEHVTRIGQAVARLHRALAELASGMCVRLADEVRAACERKSNRDRGRFKISFDAALCPALDEFRVIQSRTDDPILRLARLWGASPWVESDRPRSLDRIAQELGRFVRVSPHEDFGGFVVHLPGRPFGRTIAHLAAGVRYLLCELGDRDGSAKHYQSGGFKGEDRHFKFGAERFSVDAFSPCLSQQSAGFTFGNPDVFILLRREKSSQGMPVSDGEPAVRWWDADISLLG